ncbi:MAG: hypothetical protein LC102_09835 [Ignavibacteriales bacterium]|nr:MAG: hypothetical protein F9K26_01465 [Ignavibacteriaceae bacterium]MBW7872079.1 hypothetical protein [Ignavibacteria bacterium]MCZ2143713.1 hypothetical protein [Ignavibacteriales bacterium]OQY77554.1 MAG: hypothetical protein B6D45_02710 [Ignavibacteriales bacterium UTCHB3]MBV6446024.1 hypothetical protein [Ignavibacteriaceae bacterium]
MTTTSRIIVAVASVLLLGTFIQPIWKIGIEAPQYPEGMGIYIWINQITGENPGDLNTLNELNHYIGMKRIEPDSIPELQYMPYIIIGLTILGLLFSLIGKTPLIYLMVGLVMILAVVGIVDFYLWEYDYGHNLDPNAAIKMPGMSFQPPLIGGKQLMNIYALSLPWVGTWLMTISIFMYVYAILLNRKKKRVAAA